MTGPRVIPILLLRNGGLYKGVRFKDFKYVGDPMNAIRIFNNKNVDELFLLDIAATAEGRIPDPEFVQKVADECYMPFGVGGGIRNVDQIRQLIRHGAEKVSINSAAVENPGLITEASRVFGRQSVVVAIDVVKRWSGGYAVTTRCGRERTKLEPVAWARKAVELGAGEILVTSVDRDGTGKGYDTELVAAVAAAVDVPVIACGGAGRYEDLADGVKAGASAVAAGSLFVFHGPHRAVLINYPDAEIRGRFGALSGVHA